MDIRQSYDAVAEEYVRRISDELQHKPLDCQWLDEYAARVGGAGRVCDIGCGPGHVARYLHQQGAVVCGLDLSAAMVQQARNLNPGLEFYEGDLMAMPFPDAAFSGLTAFYSLIHIAPEQMPAALCELRRVLAPGGVLLAAFHIGDSTLHLDEWWEKTVNVDFHFFPTQAMEAWLVAAGFIIEKVIEREPYPAVEHASRRGYIWAK